MTETVRQGWRAMRINHQTTLVHRIDVPLNQLYISTTHSHSFTTYMLHKHFACRRRARSSWNPPKTLHEQGALDKQPGHHIGVQVGGRAAVLIVATLIHRHAAAHTDGASAVGNTPAKVVHARSLVLACASGPSTHAQHNSILRRTSQTALITLSVSSNVHGMAFAQLFDLGLDSIPARPSSACALGRKVLYDGCEQCREDPQKP